jgi:hypothetical protein
MFMQGVVHMDKHICKKCQGVYEYCRGCLLRPISYKENGFCSITCQEAYNQKQKEVIPAEDVEVIITDRDTSTSE